MFSQVKYKLRGKINFWHREGSRLVWTHLYAPFKGSWAIVVRSHQRHERLDTFLHKLDPGRTKGSFRENIRKGLITVNFRKVDSLYKIRRRDVIIISSLISFPLSIQPISSPWPLEILYEDDHLFVVNKPSGLIVHQNFSLDQPSVISDMFAKGIVTISPVLDPQSNIVHRLDMPVSGAMIVSRHYKNTRFIHNELFWKRRIHKEYRLVVEGRVTPEEGRINVPLRKIQRQYSKVITDTSHGQRALTFYEVISKGKTSSFCKVIIHTGRTHQIRVHFAHLGFPIVGDTKYGTDPESEHRIMLHAYRLRFEHPFTKKEIDVRCPIPEKMSTFLKNDAL